MRLRTVAELRAIVGEDGARWSDAALLAMDAHAASIEPLLVGAQVDRLDPVAAQQRAQAADAASHVLLDRRRARYANEGTRP